MPSPGTLVIVPATVPTAPGCTQRGRPDTGNTRPRRTTCSAHRVRPDRPHRPRSRPVFGSPLRQLASDPSVPVEGGSCNDYDYACGDPINLVDPDGRTARQHCGTFTCSIYFSRETTKYIADRSDETGEGITLAAAAICSPFGRVGSAACGAAAGSAGFVINAAASRAAEKGGCLKITYLRYPPYSLTYVSSNTGSHCFSDFSPNNISRGNAR